MPDTNTNLSLEISKAEITTALGVNLQSLLQKGEDITFTKETINQDYAPLKELGEVQKKLKAMKNPWGEKWDNWNDAHKSILKPVTELRDRKTAEFTKVNDEIKADNERIRQDNERKQQLKNKVSLTKLNFSQSILNAQTLGELIKIEKMIGLEKTRDYGDYQNELVEALDELTPKIKEQKTHIKELFTVNHILDVAEANGDDKTTLNALEERETITKKIEASKKEVSNAGLAISAQAVEEIPVSTSQKPLRQLKDWKVENIELLFKKHKDFIELTPLPKMIDAYMKQLLANKTWDGKSDLVIDGIRFYIKEIY